MLKKLRMISIIILIPAAVVFITLGAVRGCISPDGDPLHDPLLPRDYMFAVRAYNGVYEKYGNDFYLDNFTYTGNQYEYMWTGTFHHKKLNFDMLTYFYPATDDDTQLVFYDTAQFSIVDKEIRDDIFPKIENYFKASPEFDYYLETADADLCRWNSDCEEGMKPFRGEFIDYSGFKSKLQGEDNNLYINLEFNYKFELTQYSKKEQAEIFTASYNLIKYIQEKKYTPINFKIGFNANSDDNQNRTVVKIMGDEIYNIKSINDIFNYYFSVI